MNEVDIQTAGRQFHESYKDRPWFVAVGMGKGKIHVYYDPDLSMEVDEALETFGGYPVEFHASSAARAWPGGIMASATSEAYEDLPD